jgi:DNA repair protein RadC
MTKKQYESNICESGTWYKIPTFKVWLVQEGNVASEVRVIKSPEDVVSMFANHFKGADRENFAIALLDRKGKVLGVNTVSVGGLHSSIVHPREVFKPAVVIGAASIILAHNHPSGDTNPSREDIEITKRLIEAGRIMGIEILDKEGCFWGG